MKGMFLGGSTSPMRIEHGQVTLLDSKDDKERQFRQMDIPQFSQSN